MSFKRLHQERFDDQHHSDESESIGQDARHVEQLERNPDLETDSVGSSEQLDDQDDLPHQRQPRACRCSKIRRELRQYHVAQAGPRAHAEHLRHVVERMVERARALAHGDGRDRQLVEGDRCDRRGFGETRPHIGQHDDHERGQVEQHHEPWVAEAVGDTPAPHDEADHRAEHHRDGEGDHDARQRHREIERQCARARLCQDRGRHRLRVGQQSRARDTRAGIPGRDQQNERDEPRAQCRYSAAGR